MSDEELEVPDDALHEIAELAPKLSAKERLYVYWRSMAQPPAEAAKRAGVSNWRATESRPIVRQALQDLQEALSPSYRITRERVLGLIMEGIDVARRKDQAKIIIEGAVALANIAGVAAPIKQQIHQYTQVEQIQSSEQPRLAHLPKEELERMVGIQRRLTIMEGEFEEVTQQPEDKQVQHDDK
jgi:hypothetical protein